MDIFNPQLCLSKELKNSWSTNLVTTLDPEKIPVEVAQGVPRLKLVHDSDSKEDWFACAIPLQSSWDPVDVTNFNLLKFTLYTDEVCGGLVRLEDEGGEESGDFELDMLNMGAGEEHTVTVALAAFTGEPSKCDLKTAKLLKFVGYKGAAFYVSEICLE
jgi:hypothetical protein|tara:strand:+ start:2505 stop:2981 length:477 start_codon:yes stop_codon:yes gene_type:complete